MIQNRYTAGDDIQVMADITLNGVALDVSSGDSVVKAGIFHHKSTNRAGSTLDVTCTKPAGGPSNRVVAEWPRATTGDIVPGVYEVEFQLTEADKVRTAERVEIVIQANGVA